MKEFIVTWVERHEMTVEASDESKATEIVSEQLRQRNHPMSWMETYSDMSWECVVSTDGDQGSLYAEEFTPVASAIQAPDEIEPNLRLIDGGRTRKR
jgi:hypothetical protein